MAETPKRNFRCDDETWNAMERIAKELDRSVSWTIRKACAEYVERSRAAKRAAKAEPAKQVTRQRILQQNVLQQK